MGKSLNSRRDFGSIQLARRHRKTEKKGEIDPAAPQICQKICSALKTLAYKAGFSEGCSRNKQSSIDRAERCRLLAARILSDRRRLPLEDLPFGGIQRAPSVRYSNTSSARATKVSGIAMP
jgi:hypothetical protein